MDALSRLSRYITGVFVIVFAAFLRAEVPASGLTWNLDGEGVAGETISGTFPNAEGVEGYAFEAVNHMIWTNDTAMAGVFQDSPDEILCTNKFSLYMNRPNSGYDESGISLPGATEALGLTNDFTLEFSLKISASNSKWSRICHITRGTTVNQYGTSSNETQFAFIFQTPTEVSDGKTDIYIRADTQTNRWERANGFNLAYCRTSVTVEEWHHIAFSYDQSERTIKLYVDGLLKGSQQTTHRLQFDGTNNALRFGDRFIGSFDCVRFTPRVLEQTELLYYSILPNSGNIIRPILGHWRFEDGFVGDAVAPDLAKSSFNQDWWGLPAIKGNTGIVFSNDIYSVERNYLADGEDGDIFARNYRSVYFPGYGYLEYRPSLINVLSNFTAECFFKGGSAGAYTVIMKKKRSSVYSHEYVENEDGTTTTNTTSATSMGEWILSMSSNGRSARIRADTVPDEGVKPLNGTNWNQCDDCSSAINDGEWHHLAVTYNYETQQLICYVDYEAEAWIGTRFPIPMKMGELIIGPDNAGSRVSEYFLDEVRISEGVLPVSKFLRFRPPPATLIYLK